MRRLLVGLAVVCALGTAPARADHVGDSGAVFGFEPGTRVIETSIMPASLTGGLRIEFRSDPATCGAVGRCGLDGTVTYAAPGQGTLYGWELAERRGRSLSGFISPADLGESAPLPVITRVRRAVPGGSRLCADRRPGSAFGSFTGPRTHADIDVLELLGDNGVAGRCPGPLPEDLAAALGRRRLERAALLGGRSELDLRGDRPFTAGGFTGTVRSTLLLRLGRAHAQSTQREARGRVVARRRVVSVTYRVARVTGSLHASLTGLPEPGCTPLDSCGATGTASLRPRPGPRTELDLYAEAPARVPRRRLLATLGLRRGRPDRRVIISSYAGWETGGSADVRIARPGSEPCTDHIDAGGALLDLRRRGRTLRVRLRPYSVPAAGPLARSRCGGPFTLAAPLASGGVPLRAFGRRRLTLRLRRGETAHDDGWRVRTRSDLAIELRRTRVTQRVYAERSG